MCGRGTSQECPKQNVANIFEMIVDDKVFSFTMLKKIP